MSRHRSNSVNHDDDKDEDSSEEPPIKQQKLDQSAQEPVMKNYAKCEHPGPRLCIENLPDELIVKILSRSTFQDLVKITQNVCKQWRRLSHDSQLWCDKELYIEGPHSDAEMKTSLQLLPQLRTLILLRNVKPSLVRDFCSSCQYLTTLKVAPTQKMSCHLLKKLVEKCQNITSLTIPDSLINKKHKAQALTQLQHLHSLDITNCYQENMFIYLEPLAQGCPRLAKLKVSEDAKVSVEEFENFIKIKCKMLTHMSLPYSLDKKRSVIPLLSQCTSLIYLELYNCLVPHNEPQAFTALGHLTKLSSLIMKRNMNCPSGALAIPVNSGGLSHLRVLDLSYSRGLGDSDMLAVCRSCPELKELYLSWCNWVTDTALVELYHLSQLEKLDLGYCNGLRGASMQYVAQLPKLRKLVLDMCDLRQLLPGLNCVLDTSPLEELSLVVCGNSYYCFAFNKSSGTLRSGGLSHLRVLDLSLSRGMRDSDMLDVCRSCPQLKELYLKSCNWLIDSALVELHSLSELETLDVSHCTRLQGTAVQYVAQLPKLRKLLLESCDLSKLLPSLQCVLDLSRLEILSLLDDENAHCFPFNEISGKLLHLRVLRVNKNVIPENELKKLKREMPGLRVTKYYCNHKGIKSWDEAGRIVKW